MKQEPKHLRRVFMLTSRDIAKMLDHALLKPDMDTDTVRRGCELAGKYGTATVCVRPCDLPLAREALSGYDVKLCAVIGFPHGSNAMEVKLFEAERAMDAGCEELDMVLNIGRLVSGQLEYVEQEIKDIADAAHARRAILKVIFENCFLTDSQKLEACKASERAGADYVKTSTGFAPKGAIIGDLKLMRANCSDKVKVKAAGGIRTLDHVLAARAVGCSRCGTSATAAIMEEAYKREALGMLQEMSVAEAQLGEGY